MSPTTVADLAVVGLGTMGGNLVLNLADHGHTVAVWNRTAARTQAFLAAHAADRPIVAPGDLSATVASLRRPRIVLLMVPAGRPVDDTIDAALAHLEPGDVLVDGGNSHWRDTERRLERLAADGIRFVGMGISGGAEGARHGPSLMPGGDPEAWPALEPVLTEVAARAPDGEPSVAWMGPGGAGHFVKMVHNGIEYADLQAIAEAFDVMRRALGATPGEAAAVFARWNQGRLESFLVEIAAEVLARAGDDGTPLVDRVVDAAEQKGTGRWTVVDAMEDGVPVTTITEAVEARFLSTRRDERRAAASLLAGPSSGPEPTRRHAVDDLEAALYGSRLVAYAQGFMLLQAASDRRGWNIDPGRVAAVWRAGCIIRSRFLRDITAAYRGEHPPANLLLDAFFASELSAVQERWRRAVVRAVAWGIPMPVTSSALAFYDGYRAERLPADLVQLLRDRFGAHGYRRIDAEGRFHTTW